MGNQSIETNLTCMIDNPDVDTIYVSVVLQKDDLGGGDSILFRSRQSGAKVYLDDDLIYDTGASFDYPFLLGYGSFWRSVRIGDDYEGKTLTIEFEPLYALQAVSGYIPDVYCGMQSSFMIKLFRDGFWYLILAAFLMTLSSVRSVEKGKRQLYSGIIVLAVSTVLELLYFLLIDKKSSGRILVLGICLFIIKSGIDLLRRTKAVQKTDMEQEFLTNMEYTDVVTHLGNRYAYDREKDRLEEKKDTHITILITDMYGYMKANNKHEDSCRERIICKTADIMSDSFKDIFFVLMIVVMYIESTRAKNRQLEISEQLADALNEAKIANEAKVNFFSKMSHDIRTPLNVVLGMTQIAKKYKYDQDKLDNALNAEIASELLGSIGLIVDVAENGEIAVQKFEASALNEYFAIFMDMQMPVMNGVEATRQIRASSRNDRNIWILAITANTLASDRKSCEEAGMNGYISKPIHLKEIQRALKECMQSGRI